MSPVSPVFGLLVASILASGSLVAASPIVAMQSRVVTDSVGTVSPFDVEDITVEEVEDRDDNPAPSRFTLRVRVSNKWRLVGTNDHSGFSSAGFRKQVRMTTDTGQLKSAFLLQNDAGEPLAWDPEDRWYGFDHVVGFMKWTDPDNRLELLLGDYVIDAGQGLLLSRPYGKRISTTAPASVLHSGLNLKGYAGSSEVFSFRGAAVHWSPPGILGVLLFGSHRRFSARPVSFDLTRSKIWWRLSKTSANVSAAQRMYRNNLAANSFGGVVEISHRSLTGSITWYRTHFEQPVLLTESATAERVHHGFSVSVEARTSRFDVVSEVARISTRYPSFFTTIRWRPARGFNVVAGYRDYPEIGGGLFGQPFVFRSSSGQQQGIYAGWIFRQPGEWSLSFILDRVRGSGPSAGFSLPVSRSDVRTSLEWMPSSFNSLRLQFRVRTNTVRTELSIPSGATIWTLEKSVIRSLSVLASWHCKQIRLNTRVDLNTRQTEWSDRTSGFQVYEEVQMIPHPNVSARLRYGFHEVAVWENRLYVYEADVPGSLSIPVLTDAGSRYMAMVSISGIACLDLHAKYTVAASSSARESSRGAGQLDTPRLSKSLTLQMTVRF